MSVTLLNLSGTGSHSVNIPVVGGRRSRATWSFTSEGDRAVKFRVRYEPDAVTVGAPPVPPSEWSEATSGGGVTTALAEGEQGQWIVEFKGTEWRVSAMMPTMLRTVPVVRVTFTTENEVFRDEVTERSALIAVQLSALLSALASEAIRPTWDHALVRAAFDGAAAAIERFRNDESEVIAAAIDVSGANGADDEMDPASAPALLEDLDTLAAWLTNGPMKDWSHAKIAKRAVKEGFTRKAWWPAAAAPGAAAATASTSASAPPSASKKKKRRKKRTSSVASDIAAKSESAAARRGAQGYALYVRQLKAQRDGTLESSSVGDFTIYAVSERGSTEHAVRVNGTMSPRVFMDAVSAAVGFAALAVVDTSGSSVLSAKRLANDARVIASSTNRDGDLLSGRIVEILDALAQTKRTKDVVVDGMIYTYESYGNSGAASAAPDVNGIASAPRVALVVVGTKSVLRDVARALAKERGPLRSRYTAVLCVEWGAGRDCGASMLAKVLRRILDEEGADFAALFASAADSPGAWGAVAAQRALRTVVPWVAILDAAGDAPEGWATTEASTELADAHPKLKRVTAARHGATHTLAGALAAATPTPWSLCLSRATGVAATAAATVKETDVVSVPRHSSAVCNSAEKIPSALLDWCFDEARPAPPRTPLRPRVTASGIEWGCDALGVESAAVSAAHHWLWFCEVPEGALGFAQPPAKTELPEMMSDDASASAPPAASSAERLLSFGKATARIGVAAYSGGVGLVVLESVMRGASVAGRRWSEYREEAGDNEALGCAAESEAAPPVTSRYQRLDALATPRCAFDALRSNGATAKLRPGAWYAIKVAEENETARSDDSEMCVFYHPGIPGKVVVPDKSVAVTEVAVTSDDVAARGSAAPEEAVTAADDVGSGASATVAAEAPTPCTFRATFSWHPTASLETTHYIVEYGNKRFGGWYGKPAPVSEPTITLEGLERAGNYSVRVRAVGAAGEGEWSDTLYW